MVKTFFFPVIRSGPTGKTAGTKPCPFEHRVPAAPLMPGPGTLHGMATHNEGSHPDRDQGLRKR